jgi:hypothetical protein
MQTTTARPFLGLALIAILSIGLTACSNPFKRGGDVAGPASRTLWEASDFQYVKIVNSDAADTINSHPTAIAETDMRTLLSSLYLSDRVLLKRVETPLFSIGEQQVLSRALSQGLNLAQPNEDVNFVTIGSHPGALGTARKTTSGRVFLQNGKLNIIFGLTHQVYYKKDKTTQQEIDRRTNPLLPGFRTSPSTELTGQLALDSGQAFYIDPRTGQERRDWLVLDIATVLATARGKAQDQLDGAISPEMREAIARNSQTVRNLKQDIGNLKEILFDLQAEIDALKAGR